jgi:hypothetical protein
MKSIKGFILVISLFLTAISLVSCNLEDFNLKKLATPSDIVPDIFAPLVYGTFEVKDLRAFPPPDFFVIQPGDSLILDPLVLDKTGTSFRTTGIDSLYLITHFTNNTVCDMEFLMSFVSKTGAQVGASFFSKNIPAGAHDFLIPLFPLGPTDQNNLELSSEIKLSFKLRLPQSASGSVTYGSIKSNSFSYNMSFYAPANLRNL